MFSIPARLAQPRVNFIREGVAGIPRTIGIRNTGLNDVAGNDSMINGAVEERPAEVEGGVRNRALRQPYEIRDSQWCQIGFEPGDDQALGRPDLGVYTIGAILCG
jgi:hypothetical protein